MNEKDITQYLQKRIGGMFRGCYAKNELPRAPLCGAYVVNTDFSHEEGTHWIAVYVKENQVFLFDSLNINVTQDFYFQQFLNFFKKPILFMNKSRIQSLTSLVCGMYVCFFLICMYHKIKYATFLILFEGQEYEENDKDIVNYFSLI